MKSMKRIKSAVKYLTILSFAFIFTAGCKNKDSLRLWYRQPADRWLEALPVGNGRLGAMMFGGVEKERIALNETTLWSGAPSDENVNPVSAASLYL
jgi:alpha-L-fucosidase 2